MDGQTRSEMEHQLYNIFEINKIGLKKLRGIGFGSSIYNGLQKFIKKI